MKSNVDYKSRFRILKGGKISLAITAMIGSVTLSYASPTGGVVTSGIANITQNALTTNITQSTLKASINWQNFSIASNETVNFNQPSVSSITLNRVIGNEKSIIDGALNANGQVWILNSNGVLFNKNASINTSGLLATTKSLSDTDFQSGNYSFKGDSTESVINLGTINISGGGYASLLADSVSNEGTITAIRGKVTLTGASEATINLNGNSMLSLTVDKGVLDAIVENKGAIIADGGEIYLTTNAVDELLKGVVNNTGVLEAQTLDDVTGKIELFAHGGTATIGGIIKAENGFVETSGKYFDFLGADIKAGEWLIDPVNIAIDSTLATAIQTALGTGSVTISTDGGNTPDTSSGESGTEGNIYVNSAISWSANNLTLHADNDINFNASLTASGTASLALEYGQGSVDGGSSTYTVADGVDMIIPTATAFTWKKGSGGAVTNLVLDNGNLRFGTGTQASINNMGSLLQPFYYDNVTAGRDGWYKLTYSTYPLDYAIGVGGDDTNTYNTNGDLMSTHPAASGGFTTTDLSAGVSNFYLNIAGYKEKTGTIEVTMDLDVPNQGSFTTTNSYTLLEGATYVKTVTSVTNNTGSDKDNMRLWIGTRDDYVALSDSNYKTKGNIGEDGFVPITEQSQEAKAIIVSENTFESGEGAAVLFYSTTPNTNTVIQSCCSFNNVIGQDPATSPIALSSPADGSYGLFLSLGTLPDNQTGSITWYYAAAPVSELEATITEVGESAGVTFTPIPVPESSVTESVVTTIANQSAIKVELPENNEDNIPDKKTIADSTPEVKESRVFLFKDSVVEIVNGGVKLPDGLEPELFDDEDIDKKL